MSGDQNRLNLSHALRRNIEALEGRRADEKASAGRQERIADAITSFTGSMLFVYLHLALFGGWVAINLGAAPFLPAFDPSFVKLATAASVEAIFLSTFVLISQNRSAAAADRRADLDLHINLLAEHELTRLAQVVDAMAAHVGVPAEVTAHMEEAKKDVAPETVLDELSARRQREETRARS